MDQEQRHGGTITRSIASHSEKAAPPITTCMSDLPGQPLLEMEQLEVGWAPPARLWRLAVHPEPRSRI